MTDRTITLSEGECVDVTAALELLINHCDAFNGPANPFAERRENCEALLKKLALSIAEPARSLKLDGAHRSPRQLKGLTAHVRPVTPRR